MNLQYENKPLNKFTMDDTKETFIKKLKNYETLSSFSKTTKFNEFPNWSNMLFETCKSTMSKQMSYTSPRFGDSLSKRVLNSSMPKQNSIEQYKQKLFGKLDTCPQTCYSLIRTKYTTQNNYFEQQFDKQIHQVSNIDGKYASYQSQQSQTSKQNYLQLDGLEKYLISCQKVHEQDFYLVSQKIKQVVQQTIRKSTQIIKTKHKSHLQNSLKAMTFIDQQTQMVKQGLTNEAELSQNDWCEGLDQINDQILVLNTMITQTKLEQNDKFTDMQWEVKQLQFGCEEDLDREHKERVQKESKLYMVLQKLIQRVGSVGV